MKKFLLLAPLAFLAAPAAALLTSGTPASASGDLAKSPPVRIEGIELGARLSAADATIGVVQQSSEILQAAATPQPPKERKVRIIYPLPR